MGRLFGSDGHIVLYSFGGLAVGSNALDSGWKRALVSFAGPLAQFVLLGLVVVFLWFIAFPPEVRDRFAVDQNVYFRFLFALRDTFSNVVVRRLFWALIFINL